MLPNFENSRISSEKIFAHLFQTIRYKLNYLTKETSPTQSSQSNNNIYLPKQCIKQEEIEIIEKSQAEKVLQNKSFLKSIQMRCLRPWRCRNCKKLFKTSAQRYSHHLNVHKYSNLPKPIITSSESFIQIEKFHTANESTKIELKEYSNHTIRIKRCFKPIKCRKCGKILKTFFRWLRHFQKHKRLKLNENVSNLETETTSRLKCNDCDRTFRFKSQLKVHSLIHLKQKPFSCKYCSYGTASLGTLKVHERIHTKERPYSCDLCEAKFMDSSTLTRHKRVHTNERPYACDQCDKKFTQIGNLTQHKRIHTNERPYACDQCEMRFIQSSSLMTHKRFHLKVKPFACDQCEKRFYQSDDLNRHRRIHSGDKPYACDQCDKRFTQPGHLKGHKRLHFKEQLFSCDQCDKKYTQRGKLKTHKRLHTQEHLFSCDQCEKKYTQLNHLKRHQLVHKK